MTKIQEKAIAREESIQVMTQYLVERVNTHEGGSRFIVPSSSSPMNYAVKVDADYNVISCDCKGGAGRCMHKEAVVRFIGRNQDRYFNANNHVYGFQRYGISVECRETQMNPTERYLLDQARQEAEKKAGFERQAVKRAAFVADFNPSGLE